MRQKRKNFNLNYGVHESLIVGVMLSLLGGMLDAHTYLFRHGIFANTQTGNIVFLALSLINQNMIKCLNCIFSMIAFIIGVSLTEFFKLYYKKKQIIFVNLVLSLEIFFLAILSIIPMNKLDSLVITTISFICSLQTNSFRSLKGSPYASTMCTGNLRSAAATFLNFVAFKHKPQGLVFLQFLTILTSFFCGTIIGKFLTDYVGQLTLLFGCFVLLFTLILINYKHLKSKKLKMFMLKF